MDAVRTLSGTIVTFYSYKGGTGRSMALANVACLLAQTQHKGNILMIDWDLEAPGLHRYFQNYIENSANKSFAFDAQPGLIDLFYDIKRLCEEKQIANDDISDSMFSEIKLEKYVLSTSVRSLYLMSAGQLNEKYASLVNGFNWEQFFNSYPSLMLKLSEHLCKKYNYVLIDSRTGHTDISGICTAIMPDKLVIVFTPNKQSITGAIDITKAAVEYRKDSDDLRQLLAFPLVSRVEPAEPKLRQDWRFGNKSKDIVGYQAQFESLFNDIYGLGKCDLTSYFDDVQIQYIPRYAYGEEIAVLIERSEDRLSLARSYESFVKQLTEKERAWDSVDQEEPLLTAEAPQISENKSVGIQEIQHQRSAIGRLAIRESIGALSQIGLYYEQTVPSSIEYGFIIETEKLLNDLYIKSSQEAGEKIIADQLLDAISLAGSLALSVNNQSFGPDFVKTAKQLGRTLIRISRMKVELDLEAQLTDYLIRNSPEDIANRFSGVLPGNLAKALLVIAQKEDELTSVRSRAVRGLALLGLLDNNAWTQILPTASPELFQEWFPRWAEDTDTTILNADHIRVMLEGHRLPKASTGFGRVVRKFIERGAGYTSSVLLPGQDYPAWEVKLDCVRTAIQLNDADTISTLQAFTSMSYWRARRDIIDYLEEKFASSSVSEQDTEIAIQILEQFINDGKTESKTPTMRRARELLAKIMEK